MLNISWMSKSERLLFRSLLARQRRNHRRLVKQRAEHDRTGKHEWVCVIQFNMPQRKYVCKFCSAEKYEDFESGND